MSKFKFQLDSLLGYREHQRDQCRQLLAEVLEQTTAYQNEKSASHIERDQVCEEIRAGSSQGNVDVQSNGSRRFYLSQIDLKINQIQLQIEQTMQHVEMCRKALQQADAAVKALEQLKDNRLQKHEYHEAKQREVEMQDTWSAIQQIKY